MRKSILMVLMLSLLLLLAACGGSDDESGETKQENEQNQTEQTTGGDESSESPESSEADNTLDIAATDFEFDQEEYTVQSGEEVTINLTSEEGMHGLAIDEFDVNIEEEGTATFTPEEPGEYEIYCSVPCGEGHANMKSTLVVQ